MEKLGVKSGLWVCVVGGGDYLLPKLLERVGKKGRLLRYGGVAGFVEKVSGFGEVDVVLFWAREKGSLELFFREVRSCLKPNGVIWVVLVKKRFRKDAMEDFPEESDILGTGRRAGYVDVKIASLSDSEYALKFVIPIRER